MSICRSSPPSLSANCFLVSFAVLSSVSRTRASSSSTASRLPSRRRPRLNGNGASASTPSRPRSIRPRCVSAMLPLSARLSQLTNPLPSPSQALNNDLQAQIASLRSTSSADPSTAAKLSVLTTRASTAERRLAATQAQLASAEEKLGDARKKVGIAEGKWEARLRELEARLRAAEEKVKRERQGAKERVAELGDTIKCVLDCSTSSIALTDTSLHPTGPSKDTSRALVVATTNSARSSPRRRGIAPPPARALRSQDSGTRWTFSASPFLLFDFPRASCLRALPLFLPLCLY